MEQLKRESSGIIDIELKNNYSMVLSGFKIEFFKYC